MDGTRGGHVIEAISKVEFQELSGIHNPDATQAQKENQAARDFEKASLDSLGLDGNREKLESQMRELLTKGKYKGVVPDALVRAIVDAIEKRGQPVSDVEIVTTSQNGVLTGISVRAIEVKMTKNTLTYSKSEYQLAGIIEAISKISVGGGVPTLELVTPGDVAVAQRLIDFAETWGVAVVQRTAMYDYETGKFSVSAGKVLTSGQMSMGIVGNFPAGSDVYPF